ncbi:MAG: disulfide oxidoreductase [Patescibacteria group bacterium]
MLTIIVNQTLGILTIIAQIFSILLFIFFFTKKSLPNFLKRNILLIAFAVVLIATLGSLTYSEIIGYEPCKLCWFQRIFMYPQVILLGMALIKKDYKIASYSIILSIIGAVIAGYHYLLQLGFAPNLPCSAIGYSVSCSQKFVMQFGYITIPMMAFSAFVLIALLFAGYYQNKNN